MAEWKRYLPHQIPVHAAVFDPADPPKGSCSCGEIADYHVHTLEGPLRIATGDMIVCGLLGEFYPVKPEAFKRKYFEAPE